MAGADHPTRTRCAHGIIAVLCLLPCGVGMATQASVGPIYQQMERQRHSQAEFREALEHSERHIAVAQPAEVRESGERAEQQRRAQSDAERRRQAEKREEFLAQARAQAQQSNPPQPQDAMGPSAMRLQGSGGGWRPSICE
jgi:hypothetical protein